jgi:enoyl-CoA hydratase/carnithine racemase
MVIGAGIYPAETLVEWGLLSRVIPADRLEADGRRFAASLAAGPTIAHQATKRILRAWRSGGISAADQVMQSEGPPVILSQDLQRGVASLISSGPGHATFTNR